MHELIERYRRELECLEEFDKSHKGFGKSIAVRRERAESRNAICGRIRELELTILSIGSKEDIEEFAALLDHPSHGPWVAAVLSDERHKRNNRIPEEVRTRALKVFMDDFGEQVRKGNVILD